MKEPLGSPQNSVFRNMIDNSIPKLYICKILHFPVVSHTFPCLVKAHKPDIRKNYIRKKAWAMGSEDEPQIWNLSSEQTCASNVTWVNPTLFILMKEEIPPAVVWDLKTHYARGSHQQSPGNDCSYQIEKQFKLRFFATLFLSCWGGGVLYITYALLFPWPIRVSSRVPKNSRCWKQILAVKCFRLSQG